MFTKCSTTTSLGARRINGWAQAPAIRQGLLPRRNSVSTRVGRHFLASAVELLDRFDEILRIHQRRERRRTQAHVARDIRHEPGAVDGFGLPDRRTCLLLLDVGEYVPRLGFGQIDAIAGGQVLFVEVAVALPVSDGTGIMWPRM